MSINIRKKIGILALAFSTLLVAMPSTAFAAESTAVKQKETTETVSSNQPIMKITKVSDDVDAPVVTRSMDDVDRAGVLSPGGSISGTFKLTGWFGNDFNVIGCAANTGSGSLSLSLVSARYNLPCDGVARVICRETGWSAGTYSYSLYNPTGNNVSYSLMIYEP